MICYFYKDSLHERKKRELWYRINYIMKTTDEQRNEMLKRKYKYHIEKTNFNRLSLDSLWKIYKIIKEINVNLLES